MKREFWQKYKNYMIPYGFCVWASCLIKGCSRALSHVKSPDFLEIFGALIIAAPLGLIIVSIPFLLYQGIKFLLTASGYLKKNTKTY